MNADAMPAASTNADLYVVSIKGGDPVKISSTPGADSSPLYSPDGKYIAWRTQFRAGYESDRWRLLVLERSTIAANNKFLDPAGHSELHFPPEAHAGPDGACLARQRARTGERGGAGCGTGYGRRAFRRSTCCPSPCSKPTAAACIAATDPLPADASLFEIVNDLSGSIITQRLEQSNWSQTEASESLHVPLSTLNQKIKRLDIKIRKKSEAQ